MEGITEKMMICLVALVANLGCGGKETYFRKFCRVALRVENFAKIVPLGINNFSAFFQYLLMQSLKSPRTQATGPSFLKSSHPSLMSSSAIVDAT